MDPTQQQIKPAGQFLSVLSAQHRLGIGSSIPYQCEPYAYFATSSDLRSFANFLVTSFPGNSWRYTFSIRRFRAISYPTPTEEMPPAPSVIHRPDGTRTIHPGNTFHARPRASSASTTTRLSQRRLLPFNKPRHRHVQTFDHPNVNALLRQRGHEFGVAT